MTLALSEQDVGVFAPGKSNPRIEEYHLSVNEMGWDDKIPWCSSFINWCMRRSNIPGTDSALARSWLAWGVPLEEPCLGCIVVLWRKEENSPKGHVGFFLRRDDQYIHLFGGNQLGGVREHFYPKGMVLGYRRPSSISMPDSS